ncbi:MAG: four-carbon acid sugar kinase family protein, partial [Cyanobacteria bacterium Co-bin8]|nr:four-carbon acid sugar kinase family protein [Cyanobacteria bacterium Co-bin8]
MTGQPKIIVLDDDPTGSQTVHSCLLLLQWDVDTLRLGLQDSSPIFFVLTNTRARTPEEADRVTREVCHNLKIALELEKIQEFLVVSRSDSTLRGHYPVETDAIASELGPFDAHFLIPAFFEGGRITRDSTHYLIVNGVPTPVHETEFAKDSVFGYSYSYLPDYAEEKTQG